MGEVQRLKNAYYAELLRAIRTVSAGMIPIPHEILQ